MENRRIDGDGQASSHLLRCPHQDRYGSFDGRARRHPAPGMLGASEDKDFAPIGESVSLGAIPAGAETRRFILCRGSGGDQAWRRGAAAGNWKEGTGIGEAGRCPGAR